MPVRPVVKPAISQYTGSRMPQIKSAKKRVRVTARQTEENRLHRTRSRTSLKKVRTLIAAGDTASAAQEFTTAQKYLDKATKTNAMHANTASRAKSRLSIALKTAGYKGALPSATKPAPKKATTKADTKKAASKTSAKTAPAKKPAAKKASPKK